MKSLAMLLLDQASFQTLVVLRRCFLPVPSLSSGYGSWGFRFFVCWGLPGLVGFDERVPVEPCDWKPDFFALRPNKPRLLLLLATSLNKAQPLSNLSDLALLTWQPSLRWAISPVNPL
jgi:hypothetical protein